MYMDVGEQRKALANRPPTYSLSGSDAGAETHARNEVHFEENAKIDPIVGRSLRFSPPALAALKAKAVDPAPGSRAQVSTFTALSAHLWQRTHLARISQEESSSNEKTSVFSSSAFGTSVSFVRHLGLPPRSFGNTVVKPYVELDSAKLAQASSWEIAKIMGDLIRLPPADEIHRLGSWIAAQPKKSSIRLDFPLTPASFITAGWHSFSLYSGAGLDVAPTFASPVYMHSLVDGMVYFVESKTKDGIEAIASLRSSTWEYLDYDNGFITTWDKMVDT